MNAIGVHGTVASGFEEVRAEVAATSHLAAGAGPDKWAMPLAFAACAWLPQGGSTIASLRALGGSRRRPQPA